MASSLAMAMLSCALPARAQDDWLEQIFKKKSAIEAEPAERKTQTRPPRLKPDPLASGKAFPGIKAAALSRLDPALVKARALHVGRHVSAPGKGPLVWRVERAAWSAQDERGFEAFVAAIGESDCGTVHQCLTEAASNPVFASRNPPDMRFFADCADLPYLLRGYYAWMRGLPFSYSTVVAQRTTSIGTKAAGNQVIGRYDIIGPGPDVGLAFLRISQFVSSEHYRVPPSPSGPFLPDTYPVAITRDSIKPGTLIFDPDGHLAVVYKVTADGRILYIDAHPDNSLTRGTYGREFTRTIPEMGAGFRRWRPQTLTGAVATPDGSLTGGQISLAADSDLPDWSDEQFYGTANRHVVLKGQLHRRHWSAGTFEIDGEVLDYYDFVRVRLAGPGFRYDPLAETRAMMRGLCSDMRYRGIAVDMAIAAGVHLRPQPPKLPLNIYATAGDWEIYSTPSRDARLKTGFEELRDEIQRFLQLAEAGSVRLAYAGQHLRDDLLEIYRAEAAACPISYVGSDGSRRELGFEEVRRRLFQLSFDPHHCIELRWGASGEEAKACADGPEKHAWFEAERRLRNQLVRTYGEKMGWTLAELSRPDLDIGIETPPDLDILKRLTGEQALAATDAAKDARKEGHKDGTRRRR